VNCQHCDIDTRLARLETKLDGVLKQLLDNGQPGAFTRLSNLENWRSYADGALKVIGVVLGILITAGGIILAAKLK
jgi:hypothetical protein